MKDFAIIKRDGSKDRFSLDKIMNAIIKAFESVNEDVDLASVSKIVSHIDVFDGVTVENIQNQVEQALSTTPTPTWSTRTSLRSSASCLSRASSA